MKLKLTQHINNSIVDPRFNGHHEEADDVLSDILRNVPHKPMKSFGYDSGHVVNQFPIPDDPPPFKPLNSYNAPSPFDHYGPPSNSFHSDDHFSDFSNKKTVSVDPNSYNIYHKMTLMGSKPKTNNEPNFVTLPTKILGDISKEGFEIQKSIQYEIKLWAFWSCIHYFKGKWVKIRFDLEEEKEEVS